MKSKRLLACWLLGLLACGTYAQRIVVHPDAKGLPAAKPSKPATAMKPDDVISVEVSRLQSGARHWWRAQLQASASMAPGARYTWTLQAKATAPITLRAVLYDSSTAMELANVPVTLDKQWTQLTPFSNFRAPRLGSVHRASLPCTHGCMANAWVQLRVCFNPIRPSIPGASQAQPTGAAMGLSARLQPADTTLPLRYRLPTAVAAA
jgi:hypothetical protein